MKDIPSIKADIGEIASNYPVKRIELFGSYAVDAQDKESDVDLLVEFDSKPVSLLTLSDLRVRIEERLNLAVDLVHAPIPEGSLLEIGETVTLYEK